METTQPKKLGTLVSSTISFEVGNRDSQKPKRFHENHSRFERRWIAFSVHPPSLLQCFSSRNFNLISSVYLKEVNSCWAVFAPV